MSWKRATLITLAVMLLAGLAWMAGPRPPDEARGPTEPDSDDSLTDVAESTRHMVERLARIADSGDPMETPYSNRRRAEIYRQRLQQILPPRDEIDARIHLALELLRGGRSEAAIDQLVRALQLADPAIVEEPGRLRWLVHQYLGLAHLRLAEQENCIARPTCRSCLFPISEDGVHSLKRGSRAAVEHFSQALSINPQDPATTWLLNIAFMTLGEYPAGVPEQFRVPPGKLRSSYDIKDFVDVATPTGLATVGLSGGSIVEDLDGDGLLDVVCSSWGLKDQLRYFRNRGDGGFEERTSDAGLEGLFGGLNICHADYDNDGDADILVLRGAWMDKSGRHPNSLLRNDGGRFVDVTAEAGLLTLHPTQTAAWGDYDGDGWLDLFIGNETTGEEQHRCELFHNDGDGSFTDVAAEAGVAHAGFVKAAIWGDYDNDGRIDLFLSCLDESNVLFRNLGPRQAPGDAGVSPTEPLRRRQAKAVPWRFEDRTREAGVSEPQRSFPAWFFDYDNDGWLDLLVASYDWEATTQKFAVDFVRGDGPGPRPRLYHNDGNGSFVDVTKEVGLWKVLISMGSNFGDLDNDGFLDIYIGTGEPDLGALMPNRMFRNAGGESFQDVTSSGGFGHLQKGHGISFADIDGDGDQDLYTVLGGAYEGDIFQNALFENPGHGNRWITLRLEGVAANRCAIGARVEIRIEEGGSTRNICRVVGTGGSFGSSSLWLEVGLGQATEIRRIRVTWPGSGIVDTIRGAPLDSVVRVREGESRAHVLEHRSYQLQRG